MTEDFRRSEENRSRYFRALNWMEAISIPLGVGWLEHVEGRERKERTEKVTLRTCCTALEALFAPQLFPTQDALECLLWRKDPYGKPSLEWIGKIQDWAKEAGNISVINLHVSNSHDGDASIVLAAYDPDLVGIGIDAVYLPRLRQSRKNRAYLLRFARHFMSDVEWDAFASLAESESEEALRVRVAAHFSLMEAASKACGTGLKIGAGLGGAFSLPKKSLGVHRLAEKTELHFGREAKVRLTTLQVARYQAAWSSDETYLVSAVFFWK